MHLAHVVMGGNPLHVMSSIAMSTGATRIDISKDYLHFSAGHFTIFSATERERLHGHNFFVEAEATGPVGDDGLCFDYNELKRILKGLCDGLDEYTLLPMHSPHLAIETSDEYITAVFDGAKMPFLRQDVLLLPVANVTVEALAAWFVDQLDADESFRALPIDALTLRVSSGPGQWASAQWPS